MKSCSACDRIVLIVCSEALTVRHYHDETVSQKRQRCDGGENQELVFCRIDRIAAGDDLTGHHARHRHNAAGSQRGGSRQQTQTNRRDDGREIGRASCRERV